MTTESTEPLTLAGQPMDDLLDELDVLADQSNLPGADRISLDRFYAELNRIHAVACRRLGEAPRPVRSKGLPGPDFVATEEDIEDALAYWMLTCSKAENHAPGEAISADEVWAEDEEEINEYEEAFADYRRLSPLEFRSALESRMASCRRTLDGGDYFSASEARTAFDPTMAGCLAALAECQQLTTDQFQAAFEPRVASYRKTLSEVRRRDTTHFLAQAVASCAANLTEINASDNFPGLGLMASAAWSVAAFELALEHGDEFAVARFWRIFDSEISQHVDDLAERQSSAE